MGHRLQKQFRKRDNTVYGNKQTRLVYKKIYKYS